MVYPALVPGGSDRTIAITVLRASGPQSPLEKVRGQHSGNLGSHSPQVYHADFHRSFVHFLSLYYSFIGKDLPTSIIRLYLGEQ